MNARTSERTNERMNFIINQTIRVVPPQKRFDMERYGGYWIVLDRYLELFRSRSS